MADIRDWGAFLRGRWNWTRGGYESDFPRGCQFTDIDAAVEFDGRSLIIEPKHYDGLGDLPRDIPTGQRIFLEKEAALGKVVFVLYGCGACNDPYAIEYISELRPRRERKLYDWRSYPKGKRRKALKDHIDWAMGLSAEHRQDAA